MTAVGSKLRSSRAVPLLVRDGLDEHLVETVSEQLSGSRIEVVDSVFEAVYITGTTRVNRPISSVILSDNTGFTHREMVDAFKTMDPGVRLILVLQEGGAERIEEVVKSGFSAAIALPLQKAELDVLLRDPNASDQRIENHPPPAREEPGRSDAHTLEQESGREINEVERALEKARRQNEVRQKLQSAPADTGPRSGSATGPDEGELQMVRSMVTQGRVIEHALNLIERRTGLSELHFIPPELTHADQLSPAESSALLNGTVLPINCPEGNLGRLVSAAAGSQAVLAPWVEWLAQWILLQMKTEELEQMAWTDHLTGAGNRRALERVLDSVLERAGNDQQAVTVMCFDIDDFKQYNDRFGHEAGDNVLCETVQLLSSVIRRGDHVFRVGGDEFVVVFADPSGPRSPSSQPPESIEQIAERFQQQVGNLQLPQIGMDAPGSLSISAGLVTYPRDGNTTRELLSKADKLALKSKRSGKNVITFGPATENFRPPSPEAP